MVPEPIVRMAWLLLLAVHLMPALVLFRPALVERLYEASPGGTVGTLLIHCGALFFGIVVMCVWACFSPPVRRLASVVVGLSVLSFLVLHLRAGSPFPLRTIAIANSLALVPLLVVLADAWSLTD
jgi:hypothetical protein